MTYSTGGQGYPPSQQQSSPTPATQAPKTDEGPSSLPTYLLGAVLVLGLVGYLLSFGPVYGDSEYSEFRIVGFTANFAVVALLFAGFLAAVAVLPKQRSYTGLVCVIALTGFLIAILELITNADVAGWALIAIVIVGGLQALSSIGALLLESGVVSPPAPKPKYDQYPQQYGGGYYGQPPQQHVGHQLSSPQPQHSGQHSGYPQYGGGYTSGPSTGGYAASGQHAGPRTPPTGFPTYGQPPSQALGLGVASGRFARVGPHTAVLDARVGCHAAVRCPRVRRAGA